MSELKATRIVLIENPQGLHARPADQFARRAADFKAKIRVVKGGVWVDGKSVLNLLTLAAVQGTQLVLEATGSDADDALDALVALLRDNSDVSEITAKEPADESQATAE